MLQLICEPEMADYRVVWTLGANIEKRPFKRGVNLLDGTELRVFQKQVGNHYC